MPSQVTVTLSPELQAVAEAQVRAGRDPDVTAFVQPALAQLVDAPYEPEPEALKALLAQRMAGSFLSEAESEQAVQNMPVMLENDEIV
jgi:Arc/MetJ-type ribon-helix-helix transcriptional regulator